MRKLWYKYMDYDNKSGLQTTFSRLGLKSEAKFLSPHNQTMHKETAHKKLWCPLALFQYTHTYSPRYYFGRAGWARSIHPKVDSGTDRAEQSLAAWDTDRAKRSSTWHWHHSYSTIASHYNTLKQKHLPHQNTCLSKNKLIQCMRVQCLWLFRLEDQPCLLQNRHGIYEREIMLRGPGEFWPLKRMFETYWVICGLFLKSCVVWDWPCIPMCIWVWARYAHVRGMGSGLRMVALAGRVTASVWPCPPGGGSQADHTDRIKLLLQVHYYHPGLEYDRLSMITDSLGGSDTHTHTHYYYRINIILITHYRDATTTLTRRITNTDNAVKKDEQTVSHQKAGRDNLRNTKQSMFSLLVTKGIPKSRYFLNTTT